MLWPCRRIGRCAKPGHTTWTTWEKYGDSWQGVLFIALQDQYTRLSKQDGKRMGGLMDATWCSRVKFSKFTCNASQEIFCIEIQWIVSHMISRKSIDYIDSNEERYTGAVSVKHILWFGPLLPNKYYNPVSSRVIWYRHKTNLVSCLHEILRNRSLGISFFRQTPYPVRNF